MLNGFGGNCDGIAHNTRKCRNRRPKVWQDLRDSNWPGKVGMDPEEFHSPLHPGIRELFPVPVKVQVNINRYAGKFEEICGPRR